MRRVRGLHILRSVAQLADGGAHAAQALVHAGRQGLVVEQLPERLAAIELAAGNLAQVAGDACQVFVGDVEGAQHSADAHGGAGLQHIAEIHGRRGGGSN